MAPLELVREWEDKLRACGEGPPEIRSLFRCDVNGSGLQVVSTTLRKSRHSYHLDPPEERRNAMYFGKQTSIADLPTSIYWRDFADRVRRLPLSYNIFARAFLTNYANSGCIETARAIVSIGRTSARKYLEDFKTPKEQSK